MTGGAPTTHLAGSRSSDGCRNDIVRAGSSKPFRWRPQQCSGRRGRDANSGVACTRDNKRLRRLISARGRWSRRHAGTGPEGVRDIYPASPRRRAAGTTPLPPSDRSAMASSVAEIPAKAKAVRRLVVLTLNNELRAAVVEPEDLVVQI